MFAAIYSIIFAWLMTGLVFAIPFAILGAGRLPRGGGSVSLATRLLIIPGAAIFWPYMLWRWLAVRRQRSGA